jgi:hypothetical protein
MNFNSYEAIFNIARLIFSQLNIFFILHIQNAHQSPLFFNFKL